MAPVADGNVTQVREIEPDSSASAASSDDKIDTRSLASSAKSFEYFNGRRYHGYHSGSYLIPNDEIEIGRETVMHVVWREMLQGHLHAAHLTNPRRILDVGTGSGIWAMEIADQYPNATVYGNDLSPIQPEDVPPNCHFIVDDFEEEWLDGSFDYVHGRQLMGAVKDWPKFYRHAFERIVPGGQMEMQELDAWVHHQSIGVDPIHVLHWNESLNQAFATWGKGLNVAGKHAQWMRDAGFVDVKDEVLAIPIGTWAKDNHLKEIGKYHLAGATASVEAYSLQIMTEHMGQTPEEATVSCELIKHELRQKKFRFFGKYHFITGRKPS